MFEKKIPWEFDLKKKKGASTCSQCFINKRRYCTTDWNTAAPTAIYFRHIVGLHVVLLITTLIAIYLQHKDRSFRLLSFWVYFIIQYAVCLTTGPKPLPKRFLHIVRSKASSFKWEYPLLSWRSSSSFLRLLPRLLVTSIYPFIFPSIREGYWA